MELDEENFKVTICNVPKDQQNSKYKSYPIEPLLIRDLLHTDISNSNFFLLFEGSLQFKQCILCGRISGHVEKNKRSARYILDDGTGVIELTVYNTDRDLKNVQSLRKEIEMNENNEDIKNSLLRILSATATFLDVSNLLPGTKVIVLARPSMFRGKFHVISNGLFVDRSVNRDMEIGFKTSLLSHYSKRARALKTT